MNEHVVLIAFTVTAKDPVAAQNALVGLLRDAAGRQFGPEPAARVESWWIAEDLRVDGSDCDSAVFCPPGRQEEASRVLSEARL